jgi:hypothetical protein
MIKYFVPIILLSGSLHAMTLGEQSPNTEETVKVSPQTRTVQQQSWPLWLAYRLRFGALALDSVRELADFGGNVSAYMYNDAFLFGTHTAVFKKDPTIIVPFTYPVSMAVLAWYFYPRQQAQFDPGAPYSLKTNKILSIACGLWGLNNLALNYKNIMQLFSKISQYFKGEMSSVGLIKSLSSRVYRQVLYGIAALSHAYILYAEAQPVQNTQPKPKTIA